LKTRAATTTGIRERPKRASFLKDYTDRYIQNISGQKLLIPSIITYWNLLFSGDRYYIPSERRRLKSLRATPIRL